MSESSLNEQHQAALNGFIATTAKLRSFADSDSSWFNPKPNRDTVNRLIRELVAYYKGLDSLYLGSSVAIIEDGRVALYDALVASAENAEARGVLLVQEMYSRREGFLVYTTGLGFKDVHSYEMPKSVLAIGNATVPEFSAKSKSASVFETLNQFFASFLTTVFSWFSSLFAKNTETLIVTVAHDPVGSSTYESFPTSPEPPPASLLFMKGAEDGQSEHARAVKAFEASQHLPTLTKTPPKEPGRPVTRNFNHD